MVNPWVSAVVSISCSGSRIRHDNALVKSCELLHVVLWSIVVPRHPGNSEELARVDQGCINLLGCSYTEYALEKLPSVEYTYISSPSMRKRFVLISMQMFFFKTVVKRNTPCQFTT